MLENLDDKHIVVDTNVFISFIISGKEPRKTVVDLLEYIFEHSVLLFSKETLEELENTITKSKFEKYFSKDDAEKFMTSIKFLSTLVLIKEKVNESRDSGDNKILDVAINGNADFIITGDEDLLVLNELRGIKILSPKVVFENEI